MKALVLAALLGLSAATSVLEWTYPDSGSPKSILDNDILRFSFDLELDFGYGTHYYQTAPVSGASTRTETYGVNAYSYFTATTYITLLDAVYLELEGEFEPAYVVPYQHTFGYTWPTSGDNFQLTMTGSRDLELTEFTLTVTENIKTSTVSLYDFIFNDGDLLPKKSTWTFDTDYQDDFEDPWLSFNLLIDVLNSNIDTKDFYGPHDYFSKTMF